MSRKIKNHTIHDQVAFICRHPHLDRYNLSSVGLLYTVGSNLNPTYERQIYKKMPHLWRLVLAYGMSETHTLATNLPTPTELAELVGNGGKPRPVVGSSGRVPPGARLKIIDAETGEKLGPGQVGEICGKTPTIIKGYFNRPEASVPHRLCHIGNIGGLGS